MKMSCSRYRDSHYIDKLSRQSYLYNGNTIPGISVFFFRRGRGFNQGMPFCFDVIVRKCWGRCPDVTFNFPPLLVEGLPYYVSLPTRKTILAQDMLRNLEVQNALNCVGEKIQFSKAMIGKRTFKNLAYMCSQYFVMWWPSTVREPFTCGPTIVRLTLSNMAFFNQTIIRQFEEQMIRRSTPLSMLKIRNNSAQDGSFTLIKMQFQRNWHICVAYW